MSWSVSFVSKTTDAAKRKANLDTTLGLPPIVRALIVDAINGIKDAENQVIQVIGHGHQASGTDHPHSNINLEIKPLAVTS